MTKLETLRDLLEKATPGEWRYEDTYVRSKWADPRNTSDSAVCQAWDHKGLNFNNAALIVAMKNALPGLLAVCEAAKAVRKSYGNDSNDIHGALYRALSSMEEE